MTRKQKNTGAPFSMKFKIFLFFLVIALLGGGFFYWWGSKAVDPNFKSEQTFIVKKGESLSSIANRLEKEGLIRNAQIFKIIVLAKNLRGKIQAGTFSLSPHFKPAEIALKLTHGTTDVWITFPEGWRKEEYAKRLEANLENFSSEEFLSLTKNLEGYLFPDTYLIPKQAKAETVVEILTNNFEKKTKNLKIGKKELIFASIVEREAKKSQDRPIVAGILIKRWENGWPLQADATVQYALAEKRGKEVNEQMGWWPKLKKEDLEIDSPYNTYKYKDLPPTPICNPGLSAIEAVLNYQNTDYWYYLSDKEGNIHFAKTLEEHNQNINLYFK